MLYTCRWLCFSALLHQTQASDHQFERDYIKDTLVDNLSFGQKGSNTWTDDHRHIKGWDISGEGYTPELWSDRVMLTPPWPGQRRGAIWAQKPESNAEWEAEFEFRAFGLDNGNGNMQFWYVRNATEDVGTSSIYTVGKFDGVAVVVSQTEGGKGKVRAFLNDGSLSFKDHHKVEELSFGECDLEYRNLGAFSSMRVEQTYWTFKVDIDGKSCINTYSIHLPHDYYFGITAASSEPPDSFEVKSFVVHKLKEGQKVVHDHGPSYKPDWHEYDNEAEQWLHDAADILKQKNKQSKNPAQLATPKHQTNYPHHDEGGEWHWIPESEHLENLDASQYKTDHARFKDLHDRVTSIHHQLDVMYLDLTLLKQQMEEQHDKVLKILHTVDGDIDSSRHTVEAVEKAVQAVKNDVARHTTDAVEKAVGKVKDELGASELKELVRQLHWALNDNHLSVTEAISSNSPRMNFFVILIVASNIILLGSYVAYVRRRDNQPKKWL